MTSHALIHEQSVIESVALRGRIMIAGMMVGALATGGVAISAERAEAGEPGRVLAGDTYATAHHTDPTESTTASHDSTDAGRLNIGSAGANTHGSKGYIMAEGDSIFAQYNDNPDSKLQGIYSVVARTLGYAAKKDAVGGSGYVRVGKVNPNEIKASSMRQTEKDYCQDGTSTNVLDRLQTPHVQRLFRKAAKVLMEAGRNDHNMCDENGELIKATPEVLTEQVNESFDIVASLRDDPKDVYVFVPWAKGRSDRQGKRITAIIQQAAIDHGFQFIKLWGILNGKNTIDGVHPNREGVLAVSQAIIKRSDLKLELSR